MSRPSFRPRPIDYSKPLPIIKTSKDLRNEDDVVVNRALPAVATGVDPAEEEERHLQQALMASVYGETASKPVDIPIPIFSKLKTVPYRQLDGPFKRPPGYINFGKSDRDLEHASVDYDADYEDETFVKKYNVKQSSANKLSIGVLEEAMDFLEKQQAFIENEDKKLVPYAAVQTEFSKKMTNFSNTNRRAIFNHWSSRREKHNKPFLRLYQSPPDPSDNNPALAFRPRDKDADAASGRRLNTYENFKRAQTMRDDLIKLRSILASCKDRDRIKRHQISVACLLARLSLLNGGPRIELIARRTLAPSKDAVVLAGSGSTATAVAVRDLTLPSSIDVVTLPDHLLAASNAAIAAEKAPKRSARRSGGRVNTIEKSRSEVESLAEAARANVRATGTTTADIHGYDEHGNRFLKHMRYFAGGFLNFGVNPYDHRVFSAASERNTVRELPNDPPPFTFPSPIVGFAQLPGESSETIEAAKNVLKRAREGKLDNSDSDEIEPRQWVRKRPRTLRVRGRVGRGGRIVLDRVSYERERGVKAASYPASVEAGGVYTGGIPIEVAPRLLRSGVKKGGLGSLALLQPQEIHDSADESEDTDEYRTLIRPLKSMASLSRGVRQADGSVSFWPNRSRGSGAKRGIGGRRRGSTRLNEKNMSPDAGRWKNSLRTLPAYAASDDELVSEVEVGATE